MAVEIKEGGLYRLNKEGSYRLIWVRYICPTEGAHFEYIRRDERDSPYQDEGVLCEEELAGMVDLDLSGGYVPYYDVDYNNYV